MKKHLAVLAATAVLGVTSAFAANPFSDVTPQDWAYQAVAQLASQGIVNGYPDGTFQGQSNITRYEMAQMVAKAMARQDRVDAEQNAIINRLANEFAAELNNLGVRVSTLENKVGNFKFTGDARLRYTGTNDGRDSRFQYRGRVKFEATVNDNTKAVVRLTSGNRTFGEGAGNNNTASIDQVYVQHNFGKYATGTVGRHNVTIGNGLGYDSTFDGATLAVGKDKLSVSASYGYIVDGDFASVAKANNSEVVVYNLHAKLGNNVNVGGFYTDFHKKNTTFAGVQAGDAHGAYLTAKLNKVTVDGEYTKADSIADSQAWIAGISYGHANFSKQGTWTIKGQYLDFDKNAQIFDSTYSLPSYSGAVRNYTGWLASAKYVPAKNVMLVGYASIGLEDKETGREIPEWYRGEIHYKF